ncbi:MAG TPA: serine/threonine-protein kinase [Gemmatimonadaceae bacterium]|nr:serine/threonine-protein kinase [Gemmatimonadaceae bacterium]
MSSPLSPDQWQQLESIVDALLDTPPERRAALFAEVSGGDPVKRAELERLVAECERGYPLLDQPASERFAGLVDTPPLQQSQVIAERYRIVRELGRGGMSTVYLAHDLKHARDVALKVVRSEVVAQVGSARFLREIEIAARLRHPNIVPLYDSGEVEGILFYVMPYEAGRSLRARLLRDGPLSIDDTISILGDVCDALAYAHRNGIVHRDIKPDNVLLSGRHALVTDFGVARAATQTTGLTRGAVASTGAGVMLGTPAYMAPEQVAADPNVDHRADIYAVGILAYELLGGRVPFTGDAAQDVLAAQLSRAPEPIATHRPDVPAVLAELVMKCLEKRPANRWQTADEMLDRLRTALPRDSRPPRHTRTLRAWARPVRWSVAAVAVVMVVAFGWSQWPRWSRSRIPSSSSPAVAVLVFQHGNNAGLEPLAIGVTSSLIAALGDVPRLEVRSLEAVLPYRDGRSQVNAIGRALGVRWLVGGSVIRLGGRVVVSAELTDASTGRSIARREASANPGDEVGLINQLVPTVATMLRERVGDQVRLERWRAGTRVDQAFDAVNRAHKGILDADYLAEAGDMAGAWLSLRRADSALARASRADPTWVEPLIQRAWLARKTAHLLYGTGVVRDSVAAATRRGIEYGEAARRLRANDPRVLEAHGMLLYTNWLMAGAASDSVLATAKQVLSDATEADTSLALAPNALSAIHYTQGNFEQARLTLARSYRADPYAEDPRGVVGRLYEYNFVDADDREARRWCSAYADRFAPDWFAGACRLELMAWDLTERPTPDSAWRVARSAAAAAPELIRDPVTAQLEMLVAGVLARVGAVDSARRVLENVAARIRVNPSVAREPFGLTLLELQAGVHVQLAEPETATNLLSAYLKRVPSRRAALTRDRRFRDLAVASLVDTTGQTR